MKFIITVIFWRSPKTPRDTWCDSLNQKLNLIVCIRIWAGSLSIFQNSSSFTICDQQHPYHLNIFTLITYYQSLNSFFRWSKGNPNQFIKKYFFSSLTNRKTSIVCTQPADGKFMSIYSSYTISTSSIINVLPIAPTKFAPSKLNEATNVICVGNKKAAERAYISLISWFHVVGKGAIQLSIFK